MNIENWNNIKKPSNVDVTAEEGDIIESVDGVLFLLQTRNGYNNIVCLRTSPSDRHIVWTLLEYIKLLREKHDIKYVRVEGSKGKYSFLRRMFTKKQVIQDKGITDRDVYYCNLEESYKTVCLKCREFDFYRIQNEYLKETDPDKKKKCFDKMFFYVLDAVKAAVKTRLGKLARQGVFRNDEYDLVMNATMNIMERYTKPKGYRIKYLLACADYSALGVLHNARQAFWDKQISWESWQKYELGRESKQ